MFGITKEHFGKCRYIGKMKNEWSINLSIQKKVNNKKSTDYGDARKIGDTFTCIVD